MLPPSGEISRAKSNLSAIRSLKLIEADGRPATQDEQLSIARYVGFGGLPWMFDQYNKDASRVKLAAELRELLDNDEYAAARQSTLNAHYTHPSIVAGMWEMMQKLGFEGGRVLEPSMGIGYFPGLMPGPLAQASTVVGVELDSLTGRMAKLLYPSRKINVMGFQAYVAPENFFDAIIGNVPFGDYPVADKKYDKHGANIHDYFFLKSIDLLRPGGVMVALTSTGTLDKGESHIRKALAEKAELIAAFRLPGKTHSNAGTEVVTDLLVFQRKIPGKKYEAADWIDQVRVPDPDGGAPIPINAYFKAHPEAILGRLDRSGTMYRGDQVNVTNEGDFQERWQKAIAGLPDVYQNWKPERKSFEPVRIEAPQEIKPGALVVRDGRLFRKEGGELVERKASDDVLKRVEGHVRINAALRSSFRAQLDGDTAASKSARETLNEAYDGFVKKYGPLNARANRKAFADDPDAPMLIALEHFTPASGTKGNPGYVSEHAEKARIFAVDTIRPTAVAVKATTVGEALTLSLNQVGRLDLKVMSQAIKKRPETIAKELVKQRLAFELPGGGMEVSATYLSGPVRDKLTEAKAAAAIDDRFGANVQSLEKVQPADIPPNAIEVRMGAPWQSSDDIAEFADHLGEGQNVLITGYIRQTGQWVVQKGNGFGNSPVLLPWMVNSSITGQTRSFDDLMDAALNGRRIQFYIPADGDQPSIRDSEAEAQAAIKITELQEKFRDWVWQDDARRVRLHRTYNDTYNNNVETVYDGSHLTFPGMNPDPSFQPRPQQRNAVYRALTSPTMLAAHEVGAGKTMVMIVAGMEMRRMGIAHKPAIACLKANIEGIVAEARRLYPAARILTTSEKFDQKSRRQTVSQIATGEWDLVIMTHDNLNMLGMSPEVEAQFIREEADEIEGTIRAIKQASGESGGKARRNPTVKQMQKRLVALKENLAKILGATKKDNQVTFEETGIDALMVDEAHYFKTLPVYTSMERIKGIPTGRSHRATKMLMMTRYLREQIGGRAIFATGTPIANTIPELYNMQRYLQLPTLKRLGLESFDAWARTFGNVTTKTEKAADGTYKQTARFSKFINTTELRAISSEMMDVVFSEDVPGIVRPNRDDQVEEIDGGDEIHQFQDWLEQRAKSLPKGPPEKGNDTMLAVASDGRKAGLDLRLVWDGAEFNPDGKIGRCAKNVLAHYRDQKVADADGKDRAVTQMVFTEVGITPNAWGFSVVDDLIERLVEGGIPADKIINFSKLSKAQKKGAVARLQTGDAAVGIGSTSTLGTGVNAQQFLYAAHHLDVPWMPAWVEQRDGRIERHGNRNKDIKIYRYVTTGTFDQFMWEKVALKHAFIQSFMKGNASRTMVDEDAEEVSYEMIAAIASGDDTIMRALERETQVKDMDYKRRSFEEEQYRYRDAMRSAESQVRNYQSLATAVEEDIATAEKWLGKPFELIVGGKTFTDRAEGATALQAAIMDDAMLAGIVVGQAPKKLGSLKGLAIGVQKDPDYGFKGGAQTRLTLGNKARRFPQINAENAEGTLGSVEANVRGFGKDLEHAKSTIASSEKNRADAKKRVVEGGYPQQAELDAARLEAKALSKEVADRYAKKEDKDIPLGGSFTASWQRRRGQREDVSAEDPDLANAEEEEATAVVAADEEAEPAGMPADTADFHSPDRIRPVPLPGGTSKKLGEIILDVGTAMGKPIRVGKTEKGALGNYFPGTSKAIIKYHGDLDVTAHELAHALDDEYAIVGDWAVKRAKSPFDAELASFWKHTEMPGMSLIRKRAEGVAEYLRAYVVNPEEAKKAAPFFHRFLLRRLPEHVLSAIHVFSKDVRQYAGMSRLDQASANIRDIGDGPQRGRLATLRDALRSDGHDFKVGWRDRLRAVAQDAMWPAIKGMRAAAGLRDRRTEGDTRSQDVRLNPERDPEMLARLYGGFNDTMEMILEQGPLDTEGKPRVGGGVDWLLNWADSSSKNLLARDLRLVQAYMVSQRVSDEAENIDADTLTRAADMRRASQDRIDAEGMLEFVSEGDRARTEQEIEKMQKEAGSRKSRLSGAGGGLIDDSDHARAALEEFEQLDAETQGRVREGAERYRAWADAGLRHWVDSGMIDEDRYDAIRAANPNYVDMHRVFDDESTVKVLKEFTGSTREIDNPFVSLLVSTEVMYRRAARNNVLRSFRDLLTTPRDMYDGDVLPLDDIGRKMDAQAEDTVAIRVKKQDGTVDTEHWQFAPDIHESLERWGSAGNDGLLSRIFQIPAKVLRFGVTRSPDFLLRNVIRDSISRGVISRTGSKPWGMFHRIDKDDLAAYQRAGGGQAGHYLRDKVNYHRELSKRLKQLSGDSSVILSLPGKMVDNWEKVSQKSELVNRMAEFRTARQKATKELGYNEREAEMYAAYHARSLLDFSVAGTFGREASKYVPFLNAAIQGLSRTAATAATDPAGFAARWSLYVLAPTVALYLAHALRGKDDEEEYRQLPAWRRDLFWNWKVAPGTWVALPKPFELGVLASAVERMIDRVRGDRHAMDGYTKSLVGSMVPVDEGSFAGPFKSALELATNHNFLTDRTIIPYWDEDKAVALRDTTRASRIGHAFQAVLGADAREVDHFIQSTLGGLGRLGIGIGDIGRDDRRGIGLPSTGLVRGGETYGQRDVASALTEARNRNEYMSARLKPLREDLKKASGAKDPAEKDRWAAAARETAKRLLDYYERTPLAPKVR